MRPWVKIHLIAEVHEGEEWDSPHHWMCNGPRLYPKRALYVSLKDTEVLPLFATLSGQWEEAIIPERKPLETYHPLPTDLHTNTRKYIAQHNAQYAGMLSPFDVLSYPWHNAVNRCTQLSPAALEHFELTGIIPRWTAEESEDLKTAEVRTTLNPRDMWGEEWFRHTLPRLNTVDVEITRLICFFTEEGHDH